jgi:Ribonuclease G/E
MRAFEEALKHDKAKANVTKISELGLVEMTRKRTRESLGRLLTEGCPYCEGKGYIKSKTTVCAEILRKLRRDGHSFKDDHIVVTCNPEIADLLVTVEQQYIDEMEKRLQKKILVQSKKRFHHEKFEITERGQSNEPRAKGREERPTRHGRDEARPDGAEPSSEAEPEPEDVQAGRAEPDEA